MPKSKEHITGDSRDWPSRFHTYYLTKALITRDNDGETPIDIAHRSGVVCISGLLDE